MGYSRASPPTHPCSCHVPCAGAPHPPGQAGTFSRGGQAGGKRGFHSRQGLDTSSFCWILQATWKIFVPFMPLFHTKRDACKVRTQLWHISRMGKAASNYTVLCKGYDTNDRRSTQFNVLKNWIFKKKKRIFKYAFEVQLCDEVHQQFKCPSLIFHLDLKEYSYTNANKIQNQTADYVYTVISLKVIVKN